MEISFTSGERTIPASLRRQVITRDGMSCRRCGQEVRHRVAGEAHDPAHLHLDHVIEWASGGPHSLDNLIVCCADCNLRRPRPKHIVRSAKVRAQYRNGTYYWEAGYVPPLVATGETVALVRLARETSVPALTLLQLAARGELAATAASPIRIEAPDWYALPPKPTGVAKKQKHTDPPLPADRVAYWAEIITARRARERAAREAKRSAS